MKSVAIMLSVALTLSGCATSSATSGDDRTAQPTSCQLVATIAKEQYGFDETRRLRLNREGYAPRCDWNAVGLDVEVVDPFDPAGDERLAYLTPWMKLSRPRRSSGRQIVVVTHWMGVHFYERTCQLHRTDGQWRLVEPCPVTWSF